MPQATITVASVAPRPGKKQGHVIDTANGKWNVWNDKLHNYRPGVTYNIVYTEESFNNAKFFVITNAEPAGQGAAQNPAAPSPAAPHFPTPKDEMIFVCGALNHALSNPNIHPTQMQVTELAAFVSMLRQVWRGTLGAKPPAAAQAQPAPSQMDDEIPF